MAPALVIMAAGMGSRFGGDKQLAAVGPSGETISDYLVYDALRTGFGDIVLVVRDGMQQTIERSLGRRFAGRAALRCVVQRLDDLPPGIDPATHRTKPWGTAQAVIAAARGMNEPFGVVNADDLYGRAAFEALAAFLAHPDSPHTSALVGFPLRSTLSPGGGVNRAVCRTDGRGWLDRIREVTGLVSDGGGGAQYRDDTGTVRALPGDTPVSMNMWGLTPSVVPALESGFHRFLARQAGSPSAEYLLPAAMEEQVRAGTARVRVLPGAARWWGVTYPGDRDTVARAIRTQISEGVYPERLDA
jgi:hypothetical protein